MNAILYSLYLKENSTKEHYSFLHYSLSTLYRFISDRPSFEVIVFICIEEENFSIATYKHLDRFNLLHDFPQVKFVVDGYYKKYKDSKDPYMAKWYHIERGFQRGYEKILFLDCDTMFFKDPNYFFEKYSSKYAWVIYEAMAPHTQKVLKTRGINSGQILLHKSMFDKFEDFFENLLKTREEINNVAKNMEKEGLLTSKELSAFCFFSEQYGPQVALLKKGVLLKELDYEDIMYGDPYNNIYNVFRNFENDTVDVIRIKNEINGILHYTSGAGHTILPFKYHTTFLQERYQRWLDTGQKRMP